MAGRAAGLSPASEAEMSELLTWLRVPPGSTLKVTLEPVNGEFTSTGQVFRFGGRRKADEQWSDADIRPGPKKLSLKSSTDYVVDVLVTFVGGTKATASVRASVLKADGSLHGRPRKADLSGAKGDPPDSVTIVLITT